MPGGESEKEIITTIITENLIKPNFNQETAGTAGSINEALEYAVTGERYEIDKLEIIHMYSRVYKNGKEEKKTIGSGNYKYTAETSQAGSLLPGIPGLPDLSGLNEMIKELPSIDELEGLLGGLSGVENGTENVPPLPELSPEGEGEFIPELPELPQIPEFDISGLAGTGANTGRIVIRPDVGVFELYPVLPPQAKSEKWVTYEYTHKYPDPKDNKSMKTDTQTYEDTPFEMLPLWFMNPDYKEDLTMDGLDINMGDIEDTKELSDMMSGLQGKLNKLNIQTLINDPQTFYQIDIKDTIQPLPESAILKEKAMFNQKTFVAELSAEVLTSKGNTIRVTVSVEYEFK